MRRWLAALVYVLAACGQRPVTKPVERPYQRNETQASREFYKSYGTPYDHTPADLARFVEVLERETRLPRRADSYPTDLAAIRGGATAFARAAHEVFDTDLSLDSEDAAQLDRFLNAHVIDDHIRQYFAGASLRDLNDRESEAYAKATENIHVPDEPLFYYCAGAWWGDWLVRHRGAQWTLFPPLHPMQSFPDMVTASNTICVHPFSQVTTKLSDPEGDALAFASSPSMHAGYFAPFPLIASIADAEYAAATLLPAELRGKNVAFEQYDAYLTAHAATARIYALASESAWKARRFDRFEEWSRKAIAMAPDNARVKHNLAVLYSRTDRMPEAIALLEDAIRTDNNYGRAHLTLASCLLDGGRLAEAKQHAEWVRDHDGALRGDAITLLSEIQKK